MLQFHNAYDHVDITVVARRIFDGVDGGSVTIEPGETGEIAVDKDHQVIISAVAREDAKVEAPTSADIPSASKGLSETHADLDEDADFDAGNDTLTTGSGNDAITGGDLNDASDDDVRAEIADMVTTKTNLTKGGYPELPVLNERLAAKGFKPVDADRRQALMPAQA